MEGQEYDPQKLAEAVADALSFRDSWPKDADHAWAVAVVVTAIQDGQPGFTVDTAIGKMSGDRLVGYISQLELKAEKWDRRETKRQRLFKMYSGVGDLEERVLVHAEGLTISEPPEQESIGIETARGPLRGNELAAYIRKLEERQVARMVEVDDEQIYESIENEVWTMKAVETPHGIGLVIHRLEE
jgi:hypothetical protein